MSQEKPGKTKVVTQGRVFCPQDDTVINFRSILLIARAEQSHWCRSKRKNNSNGTAQLVFTHSVPTLCGRHIDCLDIFVTNEDQLTVAAAQPQQGRSSSSLKPPSMVMLRKY